MVLNPTPPEPIEKIVFVSVEKEGLGKAGKIVIGVGVPSVVILACLACILYMKKRDLPNKTQECVTKKEVEEDPDTEKIPHPI